MTAQIVAFPCPSQLDEAHKVAFRIRELDTLIEHAQHKLRSKEEAKVYGDYVYERNQLEKQLQELVISL